MNEADAQMQEVMNGIADKANAWSQGNLELGGVCDFCAKPFSETGGTEAIATFITAARIQALSGIDPVTLGAGSIVIVDSPEWAACPACAEAIEVDQDPYRLADYVIANRGERARDIPYELYPQLRDSLAQTYEELYRGGLHRQEENDGPA